MELAHGGDVADVDDTPSRLPQSTPELTCSFGDFRFLHLQPETLSGLRRALGLHLGTSEVLDEGRRMVEAPGSNSQPTG